MNRIVHGAFLLGLLALATPGGATEALGRVFMTPEQRLELDELREAGGEAPAAASVQLPSGTVRADGRVVVNGIVRRSRGPEVVWVNGSRTGTPDDRIRLRAGPDQANRVTLEDAAAGRTVQLKPGQFWDTATDVVADCHGCGTPAPAAEVAPALPTPSAEETAEDTPKDTAEKP